MASQGQPPDRNKLSPTHKFKHTLARNPKADETSRTLCTKFTDATRPLFLERAPRSDEEARRPWKVLGNKVDGVPDAELAEFKEAAVAATLQYLQLPPVRTTLAWRHPRCCPACAVSHVAPGARLAQSSPSLERVCHTSHTLAPLSPRVWLTARLRGGAASQPAAVPEAGGV
jgi:hypothetical protein